MAAFGPIGGMEVWFLGFICMLLLGPLLIALIIYLVVKRRTASRGEVPAPGWLPDPTGRHELRYWGGSLWTANVRDAGVQSVDKFTAEDRRRSI